MHYFKHRMSKDIDIFLNNSQYLNFFLPSLNGYLEGIASDYTNQSNFIKIKIENYEIDFIVAKNITGITPKIEMIDDFRVPMEHPFEIIAKKIYYRHNSFTIRDIFDLAMLYNSDASGLLNTLSILDDDILKSLAVRINDLAQNDSSIMQLRNIDRLIGSKSIAGQEFSLCIKFANAISPGGKGESEKMPAG